jgi:chromosome segregation ATPase
MQRSAWERDKSTREQLMAESLTIDQKLAARRLDLSNMQARLNYLKPEASKAQSELDRALAERAKADAQRAALEAQINLLRQQLDVGQSQLLSLTENQTRRRADVASLNDEQGKLQLAVQQLAIEQTRQQAAVQRLESTIKSLRQLHADIAHEIASRGGDVDHLKKQSDSLRKVVSSLDQQRLLLVTQLQHLQDDAAKLKPLSEHVAGVELRAADLESQTEKLQYERKELIQAVEVLQEQRRDAIMIKMVGEVNFNGRKANIYNTREWLMEPDHRRLQSHSLEVLNEFLNRMILKPRTPPEPPSAPGVSLEAASMAVLVPPDGPLTLPH